MANKSFAFLTATDTFVGSDHTDVDVYEDFEAVAALVY